MLTIVGISTFMSRKKSCSTELSMKKSFITSGPVFTYTVSYLRVRGKVIHCHKATQVLHALIYMREVNSGKCFFIFLKLVFFLKT